MGEMGRGGGAAIKGDQPSKVMIKRTSCCMGIRQPARGSAAYSGHYLLGTASSRSSPSLFSLDTSPFSSNPHICADDRRFEKINSSPLSDIWDKWLASSRDPGGHLDVSIQKHKSTKEFQVAGPQYCNDCHDP